jgi:sugar lactone lactonase YvrE
MVCFRRPWMFLAVLPLVACGGTTASRDETGTAGATTPVLGGDGTGGDGGGGAPAGGGARSGGASAGGSNGGVTSACAVPPTSGASVVDVAFLPNVTVTTLAGGASSGAVDGPSLTASFANPVSVIIEPAGTLVVCDFDNDSLRRIDMSGGTAVVSTLTKQDHFSRPFGLAFGVDSALYVDTDYDAAGTKDAHSGTIWRVDATTGAATVVAADLGRPRSLSALPDGRLVLGDYQNQRVRLLDPLTGTVSDLVTGTCAMGADGGSTEPPFAVPYGVAITAGGIVVADEDNHQLRAVALSGIVSPFAGGEVGTADGPRLTSRFDHPTALATDAAGDIFVSDVIGHRIRRVAVDGTVTTVAGDGVAGFKDGTGAEAEFYGQEGLAVTADGLTLYVADGTGGDAKPFQRVRKIVITP